MKDIIEKGLLFDFYGELLTDHQKEVYSDLINNDLSISELAESYGITRQAASDLIKRIDRVLEGYEEKLKLVKRFENIRKRVNELENLSEEDRDYILREL